MIPVEADMFLKRFKINLAIVITLFSALSSNAEETLSEIFHANDHHEKGLAAAGPWKLHSVQKRNHESADLETLRIMTFNVQNFFSPTDGEDSERGMNIADIIISERVDLVAVQELRDDTAAKTLTDYLNNIPNPTHKYSYISEGPFPSSGDVQKEWYTFIYRSGIEFKRKAVASPIKINGFTQLIPPFAAEFSLTAGDHSVDFTVATIHVTVDQMVQYSTSYAIDGFHDFVINLLEQPHCYSANLIVLGDFNQSPFFVQPGWTSSFDKSSHFQEIGYSGSSSNTNENTDSIRLDRIYIYEPLRNAATGIAHVLRQSKYMLLEDNTRLSDHYPVSFEVDFYKVQHTYYRPKPNCLPIQPEATDCPTCLSENLQNGVYPSNAKGSISALNLELSKPVCRGDAAFMRMESVVGSTFSFIDEERLADWCGTPGTPCSDCRGPTSDVSIMNQCADRVMCQKLKEKLYQLGMKMKECITEERKIIIHEAWDEPNSEYPEGKSDGTLHSVGQEAIISLSLPNQFYSSDSSMVSKLASLAVCVGFDFVKINGETVSVAVAKCNQDNAVIPVCQKPFLCDGKYIGPDKGTVFHYFETVKAVCNPGYQLYGQISRLCVGGDQEWSGSDPVCVEQCTSVNIPSCSKPVFDYIKGTITFKCLSGCIPTPGGVNAPLTCNPLTKKFEGSNTYTCQKVTTTCRPDPLNPLNGYMNTWFGVAGQVGSVLVFSCDPDYRLEGNGVIYCKGNGQWSDMFPTCTSTKLVTDLYIRGFTYVRSSSPVNPYNPDSLANATYTGKLHFPYPPLVVPGSYVKQKQRIIFKEMVQSQLNSLYLYYTVEGDPYPAVRRITSEFFNGHLTRPLPYNFTGEYDSNRCLLYISGVVTSALQDISEAYGSALLEFCQGCTSICKIRSPKLTVTVADPWGSNLTGTYNLNLDTSDIPVRGSKMFEILKVEMSATVRSTIDNAYLKERTIKTSASLPQPLSFSVSGEYSYARNTISSSLYGSLRGQTFDLNASISLNILNSRISRFDFKGTIITPFALDVEGIYKLSTENMDTLVLKGSALFEGIATLDVEVSTKLNLLSKTLSNFEFEGSLKSPFDARLYNDYESLSTSSVSLSGRMTRTDDTFVILETFLDMSGRLLDSIKVTGYLPSPFAGITFEGIYDKSCACSVIKATVVGSEFSITLSGILEFYSGTFSTIDHLDVVLKFFHPVSVILNGTYYFSNITGTPNISTFGEFNIPYISLNAIVEALIKDKSTANLLRFHVQGTFDQPLGLKAEGDYVTQSKQLVLYGSLDYSYATLYGSTVYTFRQDVEDKASLLKDLTLNGMLRHPFRLDVSGFYSFLEEKFTLEGTVNVSEFLSLTTDVHLDSSTSPPNLGSIDMSGKLETLVPFPVKFSGTYDVASQSVKLVSKAYLGSAELTAITYTRLENDVFILEPVYLEGDLESPLSIRVNTSYQPSRDPYLRLEGIMKINGSFFVVNVLAEAVENSNSLILNKATFEGQIPTPFTFNVNGTYTSGNSVLLGGHINLTPMIIQLSTTVQLRQYPREYGVLHLTGKLKSPLRGRVFAQYTSGDLVMTGTVYESDLRFVVKVTFSTSDVESMKFSTTYTPLALELSGYYDIYKHKLPLIGEVSIPESPDVRINCYIDFNQGRTLSNISLILNFTNPPLTLTGAGSIETVNYRLTGKLVIHTLELDASTVVHLGHRKSLSSVELSMDLAIPFRRDLKFTFTGEYNKVSNDLFYLKGQKSKGENQYRALVIMSTDGLRVVSLFIDELSYVDLLQDYVNINLSSTIPPILLKDVVIYEAANLAAYEGITYERGYFSLASTEILFLPKFTVKASMSLTYPEVFEGNGVAENAVDWNILVLCKEEDQQCTSTSPKLILHSQPSNDIQKVLVRGGMKFMGVVLGNTEFEVKNKYMEGTLQLTDSVSGSLQGVQSQEIVMYWSEEGFTTDLMVVIDSFTFNDAVSPAICDVLNGYVSRLDVTQPLNLKTSLLIRRLSNSLFAIAAEYSGSSIIQYRNINYDVDIPYGVVEISFSAAEKVTWDNVIDKMKDKIQKHGIFIIEKLLNKAEIRDGFMRNEIGTVITGNDGAEACNKSRVQLIPQPPRGGGGGGGGYGGMGPDGGGPADPGNYPCRRQRVIGGCENGTADEDPDHGETCDRASTKCSQNCSQTDAGRIQCSCREGYFLVDGTLCRRYDRCINEDPCSVNRSICIDPPGSHKIQCTCKTGYEGDGYRCEDIDECSKGMCVQNSECTNTIGSYRCACKDGYKLYGGKCIDIDECVKYGNSICFPNSHCNNTSPGYECLCNEGYELNVAGDRCININECQKNTTLCGTNGSCNDTDGSYVCSCNRGYKRNGLTCEDINECQESTSLCPMNSYCINTIGSYTCTCIDGYRRAESSCIDIDECLERTDNCDSEEGAVCQNKNGTYTCVCKQGYRRDMQENCVDVDECSNGNHNCANVGSICNNTQGSFTCQCRKGFQGNGISCTDFPECNYKDTYCGSHSVCHEELGSYNCSCEDYYERIGNRCIYKDPCVSGPCGDNALGCSPVGTQGKYQCKCKTGYQGSIVGGTCTVVDCGRFPLENHVVLVDDVADDYLTSYGQTVAVSCEDGYLPKEKYYFTCKENGTWSGGNYPVCYPVPYCDEAVPPANGKFEYLDLFNSQERPHEGIRVEYSCDFGFQLKGFKTLTCTSSGGWSNQPPTCVGKDREIGDLYPFGSEEGDNLLPRGDHSSALINLPDAYPFNDKLETVLYVSVNGLLTFDIDCETVTAMSFPNEFKSIAPFWADADTTLYNGDDSIGKVWYRVEKDQDLLDRNLGEVRKVFAGHTSYSPDWLLIVTWYKIGYYKQHYDKLNTFQAVLSTDGNYSFVTFLYPTGDIQWTTGDAHGGKSGLGGDPAKVGLNVGDWSRYYRVQGSGTNDVINVDQRSNTIWKGIYMFEVDSQTFTTLSALVNEISTKHKRATSEQDEHSSVELSVFPKTINSAGGSVLAITGVKFEASAEITCIFPGTDKVIGMVANKLRAYCPVPKMEATGEIEVKIAINGVHYSSYITAESLDYTSKVEITVPNILLFFDGDPITLTWNPSDILASDIAPPSTYSVLIEAYSLHNSQWKLIETYDHFIENSGKVELVSFPSKVIASPQHPITIMAFRVVCADSSDLPQYIQSAVDKKEIGIWSHYIYYMPPYYQQHAQELCQAWYVKNRYSLVNPNSACPCRTDQAEQVNSGFYELLTPYDKKLQQFLSPKSTRCFHSMTSGQKCCYDTNGHLLTGPHSGSTPDSGGGNWFVHQTQDILPQIHCCKAAHSNCSQFYALRPSDNCKNFNPDLPGILFGNGHIITLDGLEYSHQGNGEYLVLRAHDDFTVQVRSSMDLEDLPAITTSFVSVAVTARSSDVVEVQRSFVRGVDIFVNGERLIVGCPAEWKFRNVIIRCTGEKVVTLEFSNRGVVKIETVDSSLLIQVSLLSSSYRGHTEGLLGQWNGDPSDDLQAPNGVSINSDSNLYDTHFRFAEKWRVNDSNSLFTYQSGVSNKDYNNLTLVPYFDATELHVTGMANVCGNNLKCLFDVATTKHAQMGQIFMNVHEYYSKLQEMSKPISCNGSCDNGGACVRPNTCSCPVAFTGSNCEKDVDECALSLDNCPGICVNTHGSFECRCISGYAMMNGNCLDVNECLHNNGSCSCESDSQCGAVCINTPGSYHCSCSDGYTLAEDMRTCVAKEKSKFQFQSKTFQVGMHIGGGFALVLFIVVIMVLLVQCRKKIRKRREIKRDEHVLFSEKKNLIPYDPQQCEI